MKKTIRSLFTAALSLAALCATGSAWAATPVAVWDGDFSMLTKSGYTLTLGNGDSVSADNSTIVIGTDATAGVKVEGGTIYTIVVKAKNYIPSQNSKPEVIVSMLNGDNAKVGIGAKSDGKCWYIWDNNAWGSDHVSSSNQLFIDKNSHIYALSYSYNASGQITQGTTINIDAMKIASETGLRGGGLTSQASSAVIGGPLSGSNLAVAKGLEIEGIAIFNANTVSIADAAAYRWPTDPTFSEMFNELKQTGNDCVSAGTYEDIVVPDPGYSAIFNSAEAEIIPTTGSASGLFAHPSWGYIQPHTVAMWAKVDALPASGDKVIYGFSTDGSTNNGYQLAVTSDGKLRIGRKNPNGTWNGENYYTVDTPSIVADTWYHFAIAFNRDTSITGSSSPVSLRVFMNGVQVFSKDNGFSADLGGSNFSKFYVGAGTSVAGIYGDTNFVTDVGKIKKWATNLELVAEYLPLALKRVINLNFCKENNKFPDGDSSDDGLLAGNTPKSSWVNLTDSAKSGASVTSGWDTMRRLVFQISGMSVNWTAGKAIYGGGVSNIPVLKSYIDEDGSDGNAINFTGIPFEEYDIIVYLDNDTSDTISFHPVKVNDVAYTWNGKQHKTVQGASTWGHRQARGVTYGVNALRIFGIQSPDITIKTAQRNNNVARGSISAIQIVERGAVEPILTTTATINGNTNWSKINWDNGIAPDETMDVELTFSGSYTLTLDEAAVGKSCLIKGTGSADQTVKIAGSAAYIAAFAGKATLDSSFTGKIEYEFDATTANFTADATLKSVIMSARGNAKFVFIGAGEFGASLGASDSNWSGTIGTCLVFRGGKHKIYWSNGDALLGNNGSVDNPTILIEGNATMDFYGHDITGWSASGGDDATRMKGVVRVNRGSILNMHRNGNGTVYYNQLLCIEGGAKVTSDINGTDARMGGAKIVVPAQDALGDPAEIVCTSGGSGKLFFGKDIAKGAEFSVGANAKLKITGSIESLNSNNSQVAGGGDYPFNKTGVGTLEITGDILAPFNVGGGLVVFSGDLSVKKLAVRDGIDAISVEVADGKTATILARTDGFAITKTGTGALKLVAGNEGTVIVSSGALKLSLNSTQVANGYTATNVTIDGNIIFVLPDGSEVEGKGKIFEAQGISWTGEGDDDSWATAENWSTGVVPTADDLVSIGKEVEITVAATDTCLTLVIGNDVSLVGNVSGIPLFNIAAEKTLTVEIAKGVTMPANRFSGDGSVVVTGEGSVVIGEDNTSKTRTRINGVKPLFTVDENWTGEVQMLCVDFYATDGKVEATWVNLNSYGNADSKIVMRGCLGYLGHSSAILPEVEILNTSDGKWAGMEFNNGSSTDAVVFSKITGAGNITSSGGSAQKIAVGDISGFTGKITMQNEKGIRLGSTTGLIGETYHNTITVDDGATIKFAGQNWSATGGIAFGDTLTAVGNIGSYISMTQPTSIPALTDKTKALVYADNKLKIAEAEAQVNGKSYATLADAIAAATSDAKITICKSLNAPTINTSTKNIAIEFADGISISGTITKTGSGTLTLPEDDCENPVTLSGGMINIDAENTVTLNNVTIDLTNADLPIGWMLGANSTGVIKLPASYDFITPIAKFEGGAVSESLTAKLGEKVLKLTIDENSNLIAEEDKNTWTGDKDTKWATAANWSKRTTPTKDTDVLISKNATITAVDNSSCAKSIELKSGVEVTLNMTSGSGGATSSNIHDIKVPTGAILTINNSQVSAIGKVIVDGTFIKDGTGVLTLDGNFDGSEYSAVKVNQGTLKISENVMMTTGDFVFGGGAKINLVSLTNLPKVWKDVTFGHTLGVTVPAKTPLPTEDAGIRILSGSFKVVGPVEGCAVVLTIGSTVQAKFYALEKKSDGVYVVPTENQTVTRAGENDKSWSGDRYWLPSKTPTAEHNVIIPDGATIKDVNASSTAKSVTLEGSATLTQSANVANLNNITIPQGGTLTVNGSYTFTIKGTVSGGGTFKVSDGNLVFADDTTIDLSSGAFTVNGSVTFGDSLNIAGGKVGDVILKGLSAEPTPTAYPTTVKLDGSGDYSLKYDNGSLIIGEANVSFTVPSIVGATTSIEGGKLEGNIATVDYGADATITYTADSGKFFNDGETTKSVELTNITDGTVAKGEIEEAIKNLSTKDAEAKIGSVYYATLAKAVEAAQNNDTITICTMLTASTVDTSVKNITIEFAEGAGITTIIKEGSGTLTLPTTCTSAVTLSGGMINIDAENTVTLDEVEIDLTTVEKLPIGWTIGADSVGEIHLPTTYEYGKQIVKFNGEEVPEGLIAMVGEARADLRVELGHLIAEEFLIKWKGEPGGSWDVATNWTLGAVPTDEDEVIIPDGSEIALTFASTAASVVLQGDATFNIAATDTDTATFGAISGDDGFSLTITGGALASLSPIAVDLTFGDGVTLYSSNPLTIADGKTVTFGEKVNVVGDAGDIFISNLDAKPVLPGVISPTTSLKSFTYEAGAIKLADGAVATIPAGTDVAGYASLADAIASAADGASITVRVVGGAGKVIDVPKGKTISLMRTGRPAIEIFDTSLTKTGAGVLKYCGSIPAGIKSPSIPVTIEEGAIIHNYTKGDTAPLTVNGNLTFGDKAVIDVTAAEEGPSTKYVKVGSGKSVTFGEELTVNLDTTVTMGTDVQILGGSFDEKIIKTTKLNILVKGKPFTGDMDGLVIKMKGNGVYVGYYVNEWKGASGGSWDNAENWSQGLPTADMLVAIPNGANINLSSVSTAGEIKLQGNATFNIADGNTATLGTISGTNTSKLTIKGGALASDKPIAVDLVFGNGATLNASSPLTLANDHQTVTFGETVNAIGEVGATFIAGLTSAPLGQYPTPKLVADSTKMLMYENGVIKLAEIAAVVNGKYYATINAAISAAQNDNTITVLASLDNPTIDTQKKNITINFDGAGAFTGMITKAGEGMLTLPKGCTNSITLAGGMIDRTITNTVTLKGVTIDLTGFDPEDTSTPLGWTITSGSSATIKLAKDFAAGREIVKVENGATTTMLAGVFVMIGGKDYNIAVASGSLSATAIKDDNVLIWRGGTDDSGRIWTTPANWKKVNEETPTGTVPNTNDVIISSFEPTIIGTITASGTEQGIGTRDYTANSIRLGGDATVTIKVSPDSRYFHDLTIPAGATLSLTNSSTSGTIGKTACYGTLVIDGSTSSTTPASLTIGDEFTCGNNAKIRVNSSKFKTENYTVNADIEFGDAAMFDAGTKTADTPLRIGEGKTVTFAKSLIRVTVMNATEESPRTKIIDIKNGKINIGDEGVIFPLYAWNGNSSTSFVGLGHLEWDEDGVYAVWDVDGGYYTWTGKAGAEDKNWGTDANWIPMVKPDDKSDVFLPNGAEIEIAGNGSKAKSITLAENAMAKFMLDGESNIEADRFHDITIPLGSTLTVNSTKSYTYINSNNSIGDTTCAGTFVKDGVGTLVLGGTRFDGGGTIKVENGTLLMASTLSKIDADLKFGAGATIDTTLGELLSVGEGRTVTFGTALTIKIDLNTLPPAGKKMLILEGSFDDEIVEGCALTVKEGTKTHTGEEYQLKKGARGIYLSVAGSTDRNEWIGGASGNWDESSNWSKDVVPAAGDNIPVVISRDATINLSANSAMSSIELDGNVTFVVSEGATLTELSGDYTLTKIGAGTLTLAGDCSFFAGELVVEEGLVKAEKGSAYAMGGIDIWKGATFDIAGAKLSGSSNRPMEIRFVNQGEGEVGVLSNRDSSGAKVQNASIVLKTDAKIDCNGGNILLTSSKVVFNDHTLTKTGSANLSGVVAANSVHGKLIIEKGSLIDSCDCKGVDLVVEEGGSLTIGSKAKGSFSVRDFICRGEIAKAADYPVNGGLIVVYGALLQCPDEIPALKLANGSTIKFAKPIVVQDRMVLATQSGSNDKDPVIFNLDMTGYGDEKVYTLITAPEGYIWDVANFKATLGWQAVAEGNVLKAKRINVEAEATHADGYNFKSISLDLRVTHVDEDLGEVFAKTTVRDADNKAIENQPAPVKINGVGSYTILVEGLTAGEECFYEIEFIDGAGEVIADSRILRGQHWLRVVSKRDDFYAVVYDGGKADVNKGVWSAQPAVDANACAYVLSSGVVFNTPNTKSKDDLALKLVVAFTDGFSAEWVDQNGSRVGIKVEDGAWSVYDPSTKKWDKTAVPVSANSYNTILFEIIKANNQNQVRYSVQQAGEEGFVVLSSDSNGKTGFPYGDSFVSSKVEMGGVGFLKELRGTQNSNEGTETVRAIGHKSSAQQGNIFATLKAALDYAKDHKWEDVTVTFRTNADISTADLPILDVPITIGAGGYKFRWTDDGTGDKSRYIKYDAESGKITIVKGSAPNGIDSFTSYALQLNPAEPDDKPVAFVPSDDGGNYLAIKIKRGSEDGDELEPREGFEVKYIAVPTVGETIESSTPEIDLPLPAERGEIRYSIRVKAEESL